MSNVDFGGARQVPETERQVPLPIFDAADDTPPPARTPASVGETPAPQTPSGQVSCGRSAASCLKELEQKCRACTKCDLRAGCTQVVFGEGNPHAKLMFVGEGPGQQEDIQGRPFVGAAGQLLDRILNAVGIRRDEVYIANVVKCRPPGNRLPTPDEAEACLPHLRAQIEAIRPKIIVCLGALATQTLIDKRARITRARGNWFEKDGIMYMPTFHPAALLRDETKKRPVWEDMKKVRAMLDQIGRT
ncbi:MAG TPA: uracil-DNA glycosylase [Firmicutes bacterium]|mgnify:CR=1 FL=1|nr:uracil-DNA glycosylase [Bacillota bacterium]